LLLLIGETTKDDDDWVPFEISYAIDECKIPIVVAYLGWDYAIQDANLFSNRWPLALKARITNGTAHAIHIPFRKAAIENAISQFTFRKYPNGGGLGVYSEDTYHHWKIS
jgi:hypothetical protein